MKDRKECPHKTLAFGSGDYYLFCRDCDARWASVSTTQPEYGFDSKGIMVGADASVANQGIGCRLSGQLRSAQPSEGKQT